MGGMGRNALYKYMPTKNELWMEKKCWLSEYRFMDDSPNVTTEKQK